MLFDSLVQGIYANVKEKRGGVLKRKDQDACTNNREKDEEKEVRDYRIV